MFDPFRRAKKLGLMTPKTMAMRIRGPPPALMQVDPRICYRLADGVHCDSPYAFVDAKERGPYRSGWHAQDSRSDDGGTRMKDWV